MNGQGKVRVVDEVAVRVEDLEAVLALLRLGKRARSELDLLGLQVVVRDRERVGLDDAVMYSSSCAFVQRSSREPK